MTADVWVTTNELRPARPRPPYNSPAWWRLVADGTIPEAEAEAREAAWQARSARARAALPGSAPTPRRWRNDAPSASRAYAKPIATAPARDGRMTPGAMRLLVVLRARRGSYRYADATKAALGRELGRSPRTIQRYLRDLARAGYVRDIRRRDSRGYDLGLRIEILDPALPFYEADNLRDLASWIASVGVTLFPADKGETVLSSKNQRRKIPSYFLDSTRLRREVADDG